MKYFGWIILKEEEKPVLHHGTACIKEKKKYTDLATSTLKCTTLQSRMKRHTQAHRKHFPQAMVGNLAKQIYNVQSVEL